MVRHLIHQRQMFCLFLVKLEHHCVVLVKIFVDSVVMPKFFVFEHIVDIHLISCISYKSFITELMLFECSYLVDSFVWSHILYNSQHVVEVNWVYLGVNDVKPWQLRFDSIVSSEHIFVLVLILGSWVEILHVERIIDVLFRIKCVFVNIFMDEL